MKKEYIIKTLIATLPIIIILLLLYRYIPTYSESKFKKEYESINNKISKYTKKKNREISIPIKNKIEYIEGEDLIEKIDKKENFIIYFGFSDCPWCRSIIEDLINVMKNENIEKIYYMDIKNIRDKYIIKDNELIKEKEGTKEYYKILSKIGNVLEDYKIDEISTKEKRIYAPNVVGVKDGKAVIMRTGISEDETNPYMKLTKKMREDTKKQFMEIIDIIK